MALTKIQIEHAKRKLGRVKAAWLESQMEALGEQPDADWTKTEKFDMIDSGQAKLNTTARKSESLYNYLFNYYDFPRHPNADAADVWTAQRDALIAKANAIEERFIDKLIMSPNGLGAMEDIVEAFK